jgi:hypothetical protein
MKKTLRYRLMAFSLMAAATCPMMTEAFSPKEAASRTKKVYLDSGSKTTGISKEVTMPDGDVTYGELRSILAETFGIPSDSINQLLTKSLVFGVTRAEEDIIDFKSHHSSETIEPRLIEQSVLMLGSPILIAEISHMVPNIRTRGVWYNGNIKDVTMPEGAVTYGEFRNELAATFSLPSGSIHSVGTVPAWSTGAPGPHDYINFDSHDPSEKIDQRLVQQFILMKTSPTLNVW